MVSSPVVALSYTPAFVMRVKIAAFMVPQPFIQFQEKSFKTNARKGS